MYMRISYLIILSYFLACWFIDYLEGPIKTLQSVQKCEWYVCAMGYIRLERVYMPKYAYIMKKSPNGNISVLLALCEGNPPVTSGFPSQRPVMHNFDVFFVVHMNKQSSKQLRLLRFEMSLRRHLNVYIKTVWLKCNLIYCICLQHTGMGLWSNRING